MKLKDKIRKKIHSVLGIDKLFKSLNINAPTIINSQLHETTRVAHSANLLNAKIDAHTNVGRYTNVLNAEIGKYCSISYFCTIGATKHPMHRISTNAFPYIESLGFVDFTKRFEEPVYLGNDVWIGAGAIIKPNVRIGDGAIIGAGAVVTKDVPPYAIVAGVPAKVIKYRFDEKTIKALLGFKWWDLDESVIKKNIGLFQEDLNDEILESLVNIDKEEVTA